MSTAGPRTAVRPVRPLPPAGNRRANTSRVAPAGEHVLYSGTLGLRARGTVVYADPVPFAFRYELHTVLGAGQLRDATGAFAADRAGTLGAAPVRRHSRLA